MTVVYLGAREAAVVEVVEDGGRSLTVVTASDEVLRFRLGASGDFLTADRSARLVLRA